MNCGMNGCCHEQWHGGRHILLRWLLGLLIMFVIFSIGIKIGEFKASYGLGDTYGTSGRYNMMHGFGGNVYPPMMQFNSPVPETLPVPTPTPKKTTPTK